MTSAQLRFMGYWAPGVQDFVPLTSPAISLALYSWGRHKHRTLSNHLFVGPSHQSGSRVHVTLQLRQYPHHIDPQQHGWEGTSQHSHLCHHLGSFPNFSCVPILLSLFQAYQAPQKSRFPMTYLLMPINSWGWICILLNVAFSEAGLRSSLIFYTKYCP